MAKLASSFWDTASFAVQNWLASFPRHAFDQAQELVIMGLLRRACGEAVRRFSGRCPSGGDCP